MTEEAIVWQDGGEDVTDTVKLPHIAKALAEPALAPDDGQRDLLEHFEPRGPSLREALEATVSAASIIADGNTHFYNAMQLASRGAPVGAIAPTMAERVVGFRRKWAAVCSEVAGIIDDAEADARRQDAALIALAEGRAHVEGDPDGWRVIEDRPAQHATIAAPEPSSPVILTSHDLGRDFAALSAAANAYIASCAAIFSPELQAQMTALAQAAEPFRSVLALDFHAPMVALGARLASIAATVWPPERLRAANDAPDPKPAA